MPRAAGAFLVRATLRHRTKLGKKPLRQALTKRSRETGQFMHQKKLGKFKSGAGKRGRGTLLLLVALVAVMSCGAALAKCRQAAVTLRSKMTLLNQGNSRSRASSLPIVCGYSREANILAQQPDRHAGRFMATLRIADCRGRYCPCGVIWLSYTADREGVTPSRRSDMGAGLLVAISAIWWTSQ
jgi:hypothetical protein